jgi:pimeloyl-ACP methyl ester carboxylesterase
VRAKATWRDPRLGSRGELRLTAGPLRYFDSGEGPPIVFVHGLFVNANLWRKVVPLLARSFRCISLDLPFGSHALPMDREADLSEAGVVDLIAEAVEALDLDEVTLVGMNTGGAVCQFLVTQRPERVGRLVLCSCDYRDTFPPRIFWHLKLLPLLSPIVPLLFAPTRLRAVRRLPNVFGRLSREPAEGRVEDTWVLPGLEDARIRADVNKVISIFDQRRLNEADDLLSRFERPALIAWSGDDQVFPISDARRLASELPQARLELIEGARTFSMEDEPGRLASLIADFIRETEGRQPLIGARERRRA